MSAVTQWFCGNPPVCGVFEVATKDNFFPDTRWFSYWNGERWMLLTESASLSFSNRGSATYATVVKWRGLANKQ